MTTNTTSNNMFNPVYYTISPTLSTLSSGPTAHFTYSEAASQWTATQNWSENPCVEVSPVTAFFNHNAPKPVQPSGKDWMKLSATHRDK